MNEYELSVWEKFWRNVSNNNYNSLNTYESTVIRDIHKKNLYQTFGHTGDRFPVHILNIISGYDRVVIGNHGPYIEFSNEHLLCQIALKHGEEWRLDAPKVKYVWYEPIVNNLQMPIKIYHQKNTVGYADYIPGKYYVCPYELFSTKMIQFKEVAKQSIINF